jgi:nucleoside-diphosphate-sugar epimerase
MTVLLIGGSGYVASLVLPALAKVHSIKVFDLKPPASPPEGVTFHQGSVCDPDSLRAAAMGADTLLYMAMTPSNWQQPSFAGDSFDINVKGVYLALQAAHEAGITHAVYTSSMSVYDGDLYRRYFPDEEITPDSRHAYGFTKLLGEECCRVACREWAISVNALRLCLPTPEERWMNEVKLGAPTIMTTAGDVARALLAAIDYRGNGFQPFMISGDYEQKLMNMNRAKRMLGWEPLARPKQE